MVLDVKGTFDALVLRHTPDGPARDRILKNRFYQHVSAALAGSHEYMAMEKLLELASDERFDLVVLDTPPTRHALDFLEAPDRLLGFLDVSVLRFFLRPYFKAGRLTVAGRDAHRRRAAEARRPLPRPAVPAGALRVLPGVRGHVRRLPRARRRGAGAAARAEHRLRAGGGSAAARRSRRRSTSTGGCSRSSCPSSLSS